MTNDRSTKLSKTNFDQVYDKYILNGRFTETRDYYIRDRERYWQSLNFFSKVEIPAPAHILEIGGGQMAILCKLLFGDDCEVGDVSEDFFASVKSQGIPCSVIDLMSEQTNGAREQFDAVILLEVIEHLPVPPYVIFERLKRFLKPGGFLFLTTPNLFRLRNLARMVMAQDMFDRFRLPEPGQGLGHQIEYSANQMLWHIEQAGMKCTLLEHDELGRVGHSLKARIARKLVSPLTMRPTWRDGLVVVAQKKQ